jgi:hypothetical protein
MRTWKMVGGERVLAFGLTELGAQVCIGHSNQFISSIGVAPVSSITAISVA